MRALSGSVLLSKSGSIFISAQVYVVENTKRRVVVQDIMNYTYKNEEERQKILDKLAEEAQKNNMGY